MTVTSSVLHRTALVESNIEVMTTVLLDTHEALARAIYFRSMDLGNKAREGDHKALSELDSLSTQTKILIRMLLKA